MVIVALVAGLLGATATAEAAGGNALRVRQVEIVDHNGFERPLPAARILVPHDWQAQGGVFWDTQSQCIQGARRFEWAAFSPDGRFAVELLPNATWQMNNLPPEYQAMDPCPKRHATSVRQHMEQLVQERRPGAAILDYRDRPDLANSLGIPSQRTPTPGGEMRQWAEAGEMLLGYTYQGVQYREVVQSSVLFTHALFKGLMPGSDMETFHAFAMPSFALRAPDGQLDFTIAESLRASIQTDPEYDRRMAEHYQAMGRIQAKGAADRAAINHQYSSDVGDIIHQGYMDRQKIIDQGQDRVSRAIREVEVYNDPLQGNVELPSHYDRAWRLDNGDYLLSNDMNLEPYRDLGVGGTEMEPMR